MTFRELYQWPSVGLRVWMDGAVHTVSRVREWCGPRVCLDDVSTGYSWRALLYRGAVPLPRVGEWWRAGDDGHPERVTAVEAPWVTLDCCPGVVGRASIHLWAQSWRPVAVRVQSHRLRGYRLPPGAVRCCRPGRWGNPFRVGVDGDAAACVASHRMMLGRADAEPAIAWQAAHLSDLRGRVLACACPLGQPCHADTLMELANQPEGR